MAGIGAMLGLRMPVHWSVCFATGVSRVIPHVLPVVRSLEDIGAATFVSVTVSVYGNLVRPPLPFLGHRPMASSIGAFAL